MTDKYCFRDALKVRKMVAEDVVSWGGPGNVYVKKGSDSDRGSVVEDVSVCTAVLGPTYIFKGGRE